MSNQTFHDTLCKRFQTENLSVWIMVGTKPMLNARAEIPSLGFGSWKDAEAQVDAVKEAIKAGYRHIDTAKVYVWKVTSDFLEVGSG